MKHKTHGRRRFARSPGPCYRTNAAYCCFRRPPVHLVALLDSVAKLQPPQPLSLCTTHGRMHACFKSGDQHAGTATDPCPGVEQTDDGAMVCVASGMPCGVQVYETCPPGGDRVRELKENDSPARCGADMSKGIVTTHVFNQEDKAAPAWEVQQSADRTELLRDKPRPGFLTELLARQVTRYTFNLVDQLLFSRDDRMNGLLREYLQTNVPHASPSDLNIVKYDCYEALARLSPGLHPSFADCSRAWCSAVESLTSSERDSTRGSRTVDELKKFFATHIRHVVSDIKREKQSDTLWLYNPGAHAPASPSPPITDNVGTWESHGEEPNCLTYTAYDPVTGLNVHASARCPRYRYFTPFGAQPRGDLPKHNRCVQ